jgi:amino acid permease
MDTFCKESFWNDYLWRFSVMYGVVCFIVLPLSLLKNIAKLRMFSIFAVFSLFSIIFIIIIQTPSYYNHLQSQKKPGDNLYNFFDISTGFTSDLFFLKGTATLFYSFTCHVGALPIMKHLKNSHNRRIQKVIKRSVILDIICYILVGICGYITCPINTPDLIIERPKIGETDFLMSIGRIMFFITLVVKLPSTFIAFRISLLSILNIKEENMTNLM